jgi:hypothetical protein
MQDKGIRQLSETERGGGVPITLGAVTKSGRVEAVCNIGRDFQQGHVVAFLLSKFLFEVGNKEADNAMNVTLNVPDSIYQVLMDPVYILSNSDEKITSSVAC